jgi:ketosteroid isomerase-like protein
MPFAGVGEFFVMVNTFQANHHFDPHTLIAEGDKVVALGSYSWQLRATKKELSSDFAHVWTFSNGKVVTFQEYTDTDALGAAYRGS